MILNFPLTTIHVGVRLNPENRIMGRENRSIYRGIVRCLLSYTGQYRSAAKYMDTATMKTMNTMATAENCIVDGIAESPVL